MTSEITSVPTWYPGGEKPAPMPLMLVQAFLNTLDLEQGTDLLDDGEAARAWLLDSGLLAPGAEVSGVGLAFAREVRESIRGLLSHDASRLGPLRELAETHRARLAVGDGGLLSIENARKESLNDGLFELVLIIRASQEEGTWNRLKACANPDCAWVFYDRSRNQQGNWCEMAVCGNRLKNRNLRARRR
jgi:predicted RNA-binding Zn ribbon-like protein